MYKTTTVTLAEPPFKAVHDFCLFMGGDPALLLEALTELDELALNAVRRWGFFIARIPAEGWPPTEWEACELVQVCNVLRWPFDLIGREMSRYARERGPGGN